MWSDPVQQLGRIIIVSGPSGAGKSTVLRRLLAMCALPLEMSVSATTRPPRPGEVDGRDYHFVSRQRFAQMRAAGQFLEFKEVFGRGDWYGTPADKVQQLLDAGKWVILEIDVKGAISVMEKRDDILSFFIHPGSEEELKSRLIRRNTDQPDAVQRRLEVAHEELKALDCYQYEIVNQDLEHAVKEFCSILEQHALGAEHA